MIREKYLLIGNYEGHMISVECPQDIFIELSNKNVTVEKAINVDFNLDVPVSTAYVIRVNSVNPGKFPYTVLDTEN